MSLDLVEVDRQCCGPPRPLGLSQHAGLWGSGAVAPPLTPYPVSQVAMNILNSGRFSMGSTVAGILKKLIGG